MFTCNWLDSHHSYCHIVKTDRNIIREARPADSKRLKRFHAADLLCKEPTEHLPFWSVEGRLNRLQPTIAYTMFLETNSHFTT